MISPTQADPDPPERTAAREPRVVLMSAPDLGVARELATAMVERRIAACVNLVPGVQSVYRWQGVVEEASEVWMVAKTTSDCIPALMAFVAAEHPYEVPECVVLDPCAVAPKYRAWLAEESAPGAP